MKFKYRGRKISGEEASGTRDSQDKFTLAREMRAEGVTLISAEPEGKLAHRGGLAGLNFISRVRLRDKIIFASSLGSMISAGLTLSRALNVLERQTRQPAFKKIIQSLEEAIGAGSSFHGALMSFPDVFPPLFVSMAAAGEESGNLPGALETVGNQMAKSYELRRKVRGAMIYPAIIIMAIIVIGALMMIFLVPNITSLFKELNVELPLSTRLVVGLSNFLVNHYLLALFLVLSVVAGFLRGRRTARGRRWLAWLALRFPLVGPIVRQYNSALITRTLSSLIAAGVSLIEALTITERVSQNHYYQQMLIIAGGQVEKGQTLSVLFHQEEKLFPPLVGELAEVGEETGKLSDMLLRAAHFYEDEVDQATKNLSTVIEPLLMIVIGVAVGFFAISMLGPIYSLTESL
ncbi:MAG: type II secretion system F family protein [Patescibacteria group bacterium]